MATVPKRLYRNGRAAVARLIAQLLPTGILRDKRYFAIWERRGYHVTPVHYYSAIPNLAETEARLWNEPRLPAGIDMRDTAQLELLESVSAAYRSEYSRFPKDAPEGECPFFLHNGNFFDADAEMLYCMVRKHRPARIVEIGSGFSTLVSSLAIGKNREDDPAYRCKFTAIEPFPKQDLLSRCGNLSELIQSPVQQAPMARFCELAANDILFIDSSHVAKLGSDVNYEFLEILPRLQEGVLVHVHDIFIPFEYPRKWAVEEGWFWNEQYLLQAFLSFNRAFRVVWAARYMHWKYPGKVAAAFDLDGHAPSPPASFWIERISG